MTYGNTHRFLLRLIASQSVLSLRDTKKLVETNAGNNNFSIQEMVKEINEKIKPLKQMIKIVKHEVTSEELVVFISFGYDDTTKAQNVFTPVELEFFRLLIEQIMTTETREITDLAAKNLVDKIKMNNRLSKTDAERLLDVWSRMRYLDKTDSNYALGVRAIQEFESYFCTNMPDTVENKCCICNEIVYRGYNCPNCPETIHNRCLDVCLKKAMKWPCCKTVYDPTQIQNLRGQRLNDSSRLEATQRLESTQHLDPTQQSEPTQHLEPTQQLESTQRLESQQRVKAQKNRSRINLSQDYDEEMETDDEVSTPVYRASKRMRLDS